MSENVVKFYQFKLQAAANTDAFRKASEAMDALMLNTEGFLYRSLAQVEDNLWQDIVYWASANTAAEAEKLMNTEQVQKFISHIDVASVVHTQAKVQTQVYPEMLAQEA